MIGKYFSFLYYTFDSPFFFVLKGYGKAHFSQRVRKEGPYGHSKKYTIDLGISGADREYAFCCLERSGTTVLDTVSFVNKCINLIGEGTVELRRVFLMDNLSAHHNLLVINTIMRRGHRLILRPLYSPFDVPVECMFNLIKQAIVLNMQEVFNPDDLERMFWATLLAVEDYGPFFYHCGYINA